MTQVHAQSCGAAQGVAPEIDLLNVATQQPQTRSAQHVAPVPAPSTAELNMVLKLLQTFVPEFPKLEAGDPGTRARRLQQWLQQVSQAIEPAGHHVISWWSWVRTSAESNHRVFLTKALDQREQVFPRDAVPLQHTVVESWMRPRILACLPKAQKDWVDLRAQAGAVDTSNILVFYLFKFFALDLPTIRTTSCGESSIPMCAPTPRQRRSS